MENTENQNNECNLQNAAADIFLGLSLSRQPKVGGRASRVVIVNTKDLGAGRLRPKAEFQVLELPDTVQLERFRLQPGDIVISARGSIKVAGVRPEHAGVIAGANLIVVRPGRTLVAPLLLAFLRHPATVAALTQASVGTTVPSINVGTVASLRIVVPPVSKQNQLARLIDLADEHRESALRAAELRYEIAQSLAIRELSI